MRKATPKQPTTSALLIFIPFKLMLILLYNVFSDLGL